MEERRWKREKHPPKGWVYENTHLVKIFDPLYIVCVSPGTMRIINIALAVGFPIQSPRQVHNILDRGACHPLRLCSALLSLHFVISERSALLKHTRYTQTHTHTHTHTQTQTDTHSRSVSHTHTRTHKHTHIHTHTHTLALCLTHTRAHTNIHRHRHRHTPMPGNHCNPLVRSEKRSPNVYTPYMGVYLQLHHAWPTSDNCVCVCV